MLTLDVLVKVKSKRLISDGIGGIIGRSRARPQIKIEAHQGISPN
jgi:hypothetical protein